MSCAEWEERIAEEIGGEFSAAVAEHLRGCPSCDTLANALESDRLMLAGRPPEADADYASMRSGIRAEIVRRRRVRRYIPALLAAAALVATLVLVRPQTSVQRSTSTPLVSNSEALASSAAPSKQPHSEPVSKRRRIRQSATPPIDLALLRKVNGQEPASESGSESPVEMQIATANPNVTIILLQAKDISYE